MSKKRYKAEPPRGVCRDCRKVCRTDWAEWRQRTVRCPDCGGVVDPDRAIGPLRRARSAKRRGHERI